MTILHIVWPPEVELFPHDHNMWAVIGIYGGREDNQFYRRIEDGRIEPHTGKTISQQEVVSLGSDVVHSVTNPTKEWTAALHVYEKDFYTTPRTMWSGETLEPLPLDTDLLEKILSPLQRRPVWLMSRGSAPRPPTHIRHYARLSSPSRQRSPRPEPQVE